MQTLINLIVLTKIQHVVAVPIIIGMPEIFKLLNNIGASNAFLNKNTDTVITAATVKY